MWCYNTLSVALCGFIVLAGCDQGPPNTGLSSSGGSLYYAGMPAETRDLQNYFQQLCMQVEPITSAQSDSALSCSLNDLVQAGFNDIDRRCDDYLGWILAKRYEASGVKSAATAIGALAAGILDIPAESLRAIALSLGFGTAIYDAYNNSILMGLTDLNVVRIVQTRRAAYRAEFSQISYSSFPEITYALRGYLRICTPQSIMTSANDYVSAGVAGISAPDSRAIAREEASVLSSFTGPLTATAPANTTPFRPPVPTSPPGCRIFDFSGCEDQDIRAAQQALCLRPDGQVGATTEAALAIFDEARQDVILPLSITEFARLKEFGCTEADIATGFRNYWEKDNLTTDGLLGVREILNEALLAARLAPISPDDDVGTDAFRRAVVELRAAIGMTRAVGPDWLTEDLILRLD